MSECHSKPETSFADRLRHLIGSESVSAFSRRVGLSEAMIRKYLNGSEPTLSRANQIARQANCSLEWLATGQGFQYRQAEVVDMNALEEALLLALELLDAGEASLSNEKALKLLVALYQYLRTTKRADGSLDIVATREFAKHLLGLCS
ncbi:MAG: helix-turn-helix domain-containing protein [Aeromonadaceae bacterium]